MKQEKDKIIKLLIFWDIFWNKWRKIIKKHLPILNKKYNPDFIIWNSENIAHWRWPLPKQINEMQAIWFDCLTWWNHTFWHFKELSEYLKDKKNSKYQIRPLNYTKSRFFKVPWKWYTILKKKDKKILVINAMSGVFMADSVDNPFIEIDKLLLKIKKNKNNKNKFKNIDWIILDFHRETTAESYAMSMFLDWRISLYYWTHTHVQTNDAHILDNWTGMICDIGMTGSLDSMIGHDYETRIHNLLVWTRFWWPRPEPKDTWKWVVCWLYVELSNNKCVKLDTIRIVD